MSCPKTTIPQSLLIKSKKLSELPDGDISQAKQVQHCIGWAGDYYKLAGKNDALIDVVNKK